MSETTTQWKDGLPDRYGYDRYGDSPAWNGIPGWSILVEVDWAGDYEFDSVVVWRNDETGELRAAADSGCSCPTPFGDLTLDGMKVIREIEDLRSLVEVDEWDKGRLDGQTEQAAELKAKVHRALRDASASSQTNTP